MYTNKNSLVDLLRPGIFCYLITSNNSFYSIKLPL